MNERIFEREFLPACAPAGLFHVLLPGMRLGPVSSWSSYLEDFYRIALHSKFGLDDQAQLICKDQNVCVRISPSSTFLRHHSLLHADSVLKTALLKAFSVLKSAALLCKDHPFTDSLSMSVMHRQ